MSDTWNDLKIFIPHTDYLPGEARGSRWRYHVPSGRVGVVLDIDNSNAEGPAQCSDFDEAPHTTTQFPTTSTGKQNFTKLRLIYSKIYSG